MMLTAERLLARKGGNHLFSIDPDEPVLDAIQLMSDHSIGAVLVMRAQAGQSSEQDCGH